MRSFNRGRSRFSESATGAFIRHRSFDDKEPSETSEDLDSISDLFSSNNALVDIPFSFFPFDVFSEIAWLNLLRGVVSIASSSSPSSTSSSSSPRSPFSSTPRSTQLSSLSLRGRRVSTERNRKNSTGKMPSFAALLSAFVSIKRCCCCCFCGCFCGCCCSWCFCCCCRIDWRRGRCPEFVLVAAFLIRTLSLITIQSNHFDLHGIVTKLMTIADFHSNFMFKIIFKSTFTSVFKLYIRLVHRSELFMTGVR